MKRLVERTAKPIALVEWGGDAWLLPASSRAASRSPGRRPDSRASECSFEADLGTSSGVKGHARTVEVSGSKSEIVSRWGLVKNAQRSHDSVGEGRGKGLVDDLIDEKIIGHGMRVLGGAGGCGLAIFLFVAFAIFHEPAGQHGAGVFFEPLIEQAAHLLAEIGGVAETSEFIGLQGIA
jgi:hypothetical protein